MANSRSAEEKVSGLVFLAGPWPVAFGSGFFVSRAARPAAMLALGGVRGMTHFYLFMTALFSSLLAVPGLRRWALAKGALDQPDERKVHVCAIPRLGGVAIFLCTLFSLLIYAELGRPLRALLAGATLVFLTGLLDDLYGLSPKKKFAGQILASILTITIGGLYLHNLGNLLGSGPILLPPWIGIPFTVFAVVGVCNAINLIDGLDGLAGGLSVIALSCFAFLAWTTGNMDALALTLALLGALLGFLKYNSYPARIFMGDSGSLTLGFFLAFLAVDLTQGPEAGVAPVVPLILLGLPIVDAVWVMSSRILKRTSPFHPDMTHVHHKFLNLGFQHRFTVIFIYGISGFWGLFCLFFNWLPDYALLGIYLLTSLACYLALRIIMMHPQRYRWLQKDSAASLKESNCYLNLQGWSGPLSLSLKIVLMAYVLLAGTIIHPGSGPLATIALLLFAGGIVLLIMTGETSNHFLLLVLYAAGFVIILLFQGYQDQVLAFGLTAGQAGNVLLLGATGLIVLKILTRAPGEVYLTTPLDFLILSLSLSLSVISPELQANLNLAPVAAKAIVLFIALKIIAANGGRATRTVYWSIQVALLAIALRGIL